MIFLVLIVIYSKTIIATVEIFEFNTNGSLILGQTLYTEFDKLPYVAFWKIPYAEPPKNGLRFKPPKLLPFVLNNTFHDYCNNDLEGCSFPTDDCMYLSIYVPLSEKLDISALLPVMVWLHEQSNCHAPDFLLEENVIVVAVSFRVGVSGFLNTGDDFAAGNMGAKDVVAALTWLRSNIMYFNGNANKITVYGSGTDAADVVASLILSYSAEDLFARVIIGSGSALSPKHYYGHNDVMSKKLFLRLKSITEKFNRIELYKLLMTTPLDELNEKFQQSFDSSEVRDRQRLIKTFGLTMEKNQYNKSFINTYPLEIYKKETHNNNVDVIIGYTNFEEMYKLKPILQNKDTIKCLNYNFQYLLPFEGQSCEYGSKAYLDIQSRIKAFYFINGIITERSIRRYGKYLSDQVIYPIIRQANIHAKISSRNVYLYRFSYNGAYNLNWQNSIQNLTKAGATCGDEICYIFKCKCANKLYQEKRELKFIKRFVKLWTNFVKFGDPTPHSSSVIGNVKWTPLKSQTDLFVFSLSENLGMIKAPEFKRIKFWNQLRNELNPESNIHEEL